MEGKSMLFYKLGFVPMNLVNVIELKLEFEENMVSCVLLFISIHIHTVPFGHATRNHNRLARKYATLVYKIKMAGCLWCAMQV